MSDIKQQIFNELAALDDAAAKLRSVAVNAGKQTDLEVAILTEQVRTMREKNARATDMITSAMDILKKLQWVSFPYQSLTKIIPWDVKMAKKAVW